MTMTSTTPPAATSAAVPAFYCHADRTERPVLSREADSTYWMARYMERAENVARLLLACSECMIDMRDIAPAMLDAQWHSVLRIMHVDEPPASSRPLAERVAFHMSFAPENPSSLINCLTRARENARGIREGISSDMWEHLNRLYWSIRSDDARDRFIEMPEDLYKECIAGTLNFHGLTDETLPHDQRWHFAQLGRYFERIAFTCRVINKTSSALHDTPAESPLRNLHWSMVLRTCNSQEAFRRTWASELDATSVADFLLLEPRFPRSVRHCVIKVKQAIGAISAEVRPRIADPAERILGRLEAQLEYADPQEFLGPALSSHLEAIQHQIAAAALAVQNSYFLR